MSGCTVIIGAGINYDFNQNLSTEMITKSLKKPQCLPSLKIQANEEASVNLDKGAQLISTVYEILEETPRFSFESIYQYILDMLTHFENNHRQDILGHTIPKKLSGFGSEDCRAALTIILCEVMSIISRNNDQDTSWALSFFEILKKHRINVFTLNYDTIYDKFFERFHDGFKNIPLNEYDIFDEGEAVSNEWKNYNHIHGCVLFGNGYENDQWSRKRMVKWPNTAIRSWNATKIGLQNHDIVLFCSIITGLDKLNSLMHDPFRCYHSNLIRSMASSDRVVVIGYGFGDFYINAMLHTFLLKPGHRMMLVSPSPIPESFKEYQCENNPHSQLFHTNSGFKDFCETDESLKNLTVFLKS